MKIHGVILPPHYGYEFSSGWNGTRNAWYKGMSEPTYRYVKGRGWITDTVVKVTDLKEGDSFKVVYDEDGIKITWTDVYKVGPPGTYSKAVYDDKGEITYLYELVFWQRNYGDYTFELL